MKTLMAITTALFTALLVLSPALAAAAPSGTVSVSTNASAYSGTQTVTITGSASPAPGSGYEAAVQVTNPNSAVVFNLNVPVDGTSGAFTTSFATGGSAVWITGTYTVTASVPGYTSGTSTFSYTAPPTTGFNQMNADPKYDSRGGNVTEKHARPVPPASGNQQQTGQADDDLPTGPSERSAA